MGDTSDRLYNRNIQIVFGVPGQPANQYSDLRVSFKIEKTAFAAPNKGSVKVFNLNSISRGLSQQKGLAFILRAGYGINPTALPEIFKGNITRSSSELQGADIVTTFEIGDGVTAYQQAKVDLSFSPGAAIKTAFDSVVKSFGIAVGDVTAASGIAGTFLHGLTLSGLSRDHMEYLTKKQGLEWSIQDGALQVTAKGKSTTEEAVLLTPQTGLIGIPRKKDVGIEFKCLMQPKVRPGRAVQIKSNALSGNFRCNRVVLDGDNFSKDFSCDVEATAI